MHDVFENRVRFAETDQQGVVFYGEYVTFQDEAINAFFRAIDYDYAAIRAADWDVHVAHVDLDYRRPAHFEDELVTAVRVERIGRASIFFATRTRRKRDDEVLAEGHVVHVAVDGDGETTRVPDDFREAVDAFQDEPPEQE
ncbi:acyl-CoA thioesterase [Halomarina litorea]|uniref:acyl-CoA thioesterase n=1 Tax=Halomarina litorea TaxID=2961595 RepID=UPI0020C4E3FA|nr:thioesterase family protein [Halomarina sp. BCD28]